MVTMVIIAAKFFIAQLFHFHPNSCVSAKLLPLIVTKGKLQFFCGIHCIISVSVFTKSFHGLKHVDFRTVMTVLIRALGTNCYEFSNRLWLTWPTLKAVSFTKNWHVRMYEKKNAYIVLLGRPDESDNEPIGSTGFGENLDWLINY